MVIQPPNIKYKKEANNSVSGKARSIYQLAAMQFIETSLMYRSFTRVIDDVNTEFLMQKNIVSGFVFGSIEIDSLDKKALDEPMLTSIDESPKRERLLYVSELSISASNNEGFVAGNIDWRSGPNLITWKGPYSRVSGPRSKNKRYTNPSSQDPLRLICEGFFNRHNKLFTANSGAHIMYSADRWEKRICIQGEALVTPEYVLGACIRDNVLLCIMYDRDDFNIDKLYYYDGVDWILTDQIDHSRSGWIMLNRSSPVFFNKAGNSILTAIDLVRNEEFDPEEPIYTPLSHTDKIFSRYNISGSVGTGFSLNKAGSDVSGNGTAVSTGGTGSNSFNLGTTILARDWGVDGDSEFISVLTQLHGTITETLSVNTEEITAGHFRSSRQTSRHTEYGKIYLDGKLILDIGNGSEQFTNNSETQGSGVDTLISSSVSGDQNIFTSVVYFCDLRFAIVVATSQKRTSSGTESRFYKPFPLPSVGGGQSNSNISIKNRVRLSNSNGGSDIFKEYHSGVGIKSDDDAIPLAYEEYTLEPAEPTVSENLQQNLQGGGVALPGALTFFSNGYMHAGISRNDIFVYQLVFLVFTVNSSGEEFNEKRIISTTIPGDHDVLSTLYKDSDYAGERKVYGSYHYTTTSGSHKEIGICPL